VKLAASGLVSATDLEAAKLAVAIAESQLESTRASLVQAEAALNQAQVNLSRASITSPIDGVVIQRAVDVGQTVAASLSSPELFLIAADLGDMQALAQIDETDISKVAVGQSVAVRVDAYPNETFSGEVSQIRLQPQVVSNVTTYSAIVDVPNPDLRLKPGMTASVIIEVARRDDVLRVENAALRFTPTDDTFALMGQPVPVAADSASGTASARDAVPLTSASRRPATTMATKTVWVRGADGLRGVPVAVGLASGTYTEIITPNLAGGEELVMGVTTPASSAKVSVTQASPLVGAQQGGRGRGL
jgi:HlyD family secretion protein